MINRFGHFAGEQVVGVIVDRVRAQAERREWAIRVHDGTFEVLTPDRQVTLEARRQVLTWLLTNIERLGGRRIAFHLLTEAVESLSPQARDIYRALLSPTRLEEPIGPFSTIEILRGAV